MNVNESCLICLEDFKNDINNEISNNDMKE